MITADAVEKLRPARIEDVRALLELIEPLEAEGTLVKRSRELLEAEIGNFLVVDHDGTIVGCAALYPIPGRRARKFACLAGPGVPGRGLRRAAASRPARSVPRRCACGGFSRSPPAPPTGSSSRGSAPPTCPPAAAPPSALQLAPRLEGVSSREYNSRHGANGEVREARPRGRRARFPALPGALGQRIWENVSKEPGSNG